jgi:hypothetical protein
MLEDRENQKKINGIGTLQETSLHASLKRWYSQPGDSLEVVVDGFVIDIVRENLLIEIQTRNFSAIKRKLKQLVEKYPLRLVYPISLEKWIVHVAEDKVSVVRRRKSPRHAHLEDLFTELVRLPELAAHNNFSLEALLIRRKSCDGKTAGDPGGVKVGVFTTAGFWMWSTDAYFCRQPILAPCYRWGFPQPSQALTLPEA